MAAVTKLQRVAAANRLRDLLDTRGGTTVIKGAPRNEQQGELIIVGDIEGELSVPHMQSGRKQYDDRFSIEVLCIGWDPGAEDFDYVDEAVEGMGEHVHDVVADAPQLESGGTPLDGVVSAVVGEFDGPNRWWNPEGVGAAMRIKVDVHVRMS